MDERVRSSADGRVEFNTFYDKVLAAVEESDAMGEVAASFQLVIPIDKVVTASGFSLQAFEQFEPDRLDQQDREQEVAKPNAASSPPGRLLGAVVAAAGALIAAWQGMRRRRRHGGG